MCNLCNSFENGGEGNCPAGQGEESYFQPGRECNESAMMTRRRHRERRLVCAKNGDIDFKGNRASKQVPAAKGREKLKELRQKEGGKKCCPAGPPLRKE